MIDDDVKKIKDVVSGLLEPINEKLDMHTELLESHSDKLDNHTEALTSIEATLKGYGDMYEVNKDKIGELDERVTGVENKLGLTPQK